MSLRVRYECVFAAFEKAYGRYVALLLMYRVDEDGG